jgi:uncharacterized protein (TIGR04376 family)
MGVFEDFSRFLETRLEEFLRDNPHLELMALEEQLYEQEEDVINLLAELQGREKQLQDQILETAQEIQRWHVRIEKAKAAQRFDLVRPAEEREAALLRQGNQLWGQMQTTKQSIQQSLQLQRQIQQRRKEVKAKIAEAEAARTIPKTDQPWQTTGWNQGAPSVKSSSSSTDPLEAKFRQWEMEDELDELKRKMGR